jgi:hypothetical protein
MSPSGVYSALSNANAIEEDRLESRRTRDLFAPTLVIAASLIAVPRQNLIPGQNEHDSRLLMLLRRDAILRYRQSSDLAEYKNPVGRTVTGWRAQFTHRLSSICRLATEVDA